MDQSQDEVESSTLRAACDDLTRFAPLYDAYAPRIYAFCLRRVGSPHDAEDLTSQIFVRALNGITTYRGGSVAAWLFRIARHVVADHYRAPQLNSVALDAVAYCLSDNSLSPLEQAIRSERYAALRALVSALPDIDQEILALKVNGGLTSEEIGDVVGKRAGAVRARLRRILNRLRVLRPEELTL